MAQAGFLGWKWSLWPVPTWLAVQQSKAVFFMTLYVSINDSTHPKLYVLILSPATAILVVDWCQFGPSWVLGAKMELKLYSRLVGGTTEQSCCSTWHYMLLSIILNASELSVLHLIPATAIFVVDCCQFGPSWIFGLKMELMVCAGLVGVTTEQMCLFPDLIW